MCNVGQTNWDYGIEGPTREIAGLDHTPIRVQAGPGTGKTYALKRRVKRLLEEGVEANQIFVCTFTRTAIEDIEHSLKNLGAMHIDNIYISTLHSFCFMILTRESNFDTQDRIIRPLLEYEKRFLLEDLQGDNFGTINDKKNRLNAFSAAWARLQTAEPGWPDNHIDRDFQTKLCSWLKFHRAMLVDELVPETLNYLRLHPESEYLNKFDHILVDEYQDLNRADQEVLNLISNNANLLIIGDRKQSIYTGLRYANPEGIVNFNRTHPNTRDLSLNICRRCPKKVVGIANSFISDQVIDEVLETKKDNTEGDVNILKWNTIDEEIHGISEIIQYHLNHGVQASEILVLCPRRHIGYQLRDRLNEINIEAHSYFNEEIFDGNPKIENRHNAQKAFSYLKLIFDKGDVVALRCLIGYGSSTLSRLGWERIKSACIENDTTPLLLLDNLTEQNLHIKYTNIIINKYREIKEKLIEYSRLSGVELLDILFPIGQIWTKSIRNIASTIENDNYSARELYNIIYNNVIQPELPLCPDFVRIMSLHKSKGLSARIVFIMDCINGLIPMFPKDDKTNDEKKRFMEEQQRLYYVALTRTKEKLYITVPIKMQIRMARKMLAKFTFLNREYGKTSISKFLQYRGNQYPAAILGTNYIESLR